jgi:hypothetical protein
MTIAKFIAVREGREYIGDAIVKIIKEVSKTHSDVEVIAVVPRILSYFGQSPERFEVTEADVIVRYT